MAAQYAALLARAIPGITLYEIQWGVSLAQGWAYIHAGRILDGEIMIWPDRRLSPLGRWWLGVRKRFGLKEDDR